TCQIARDKGARSRVLDSLATTGLTMYAVGDFPGDEGGSHGPLTPDQQFIAGLRKRYPSLVVKNATHYVEQLRGSKSAGEIALIRQAAAITARAERDA